MATNVRPVSYSIDPNAFYNFQARNYNDYRLNLLALQQQNGQNNPSNVGSYDCPGRFDGSNCSVDTFYRGTTSGFGQVAQFTNEATKALSPLSEETKASALAFLSAWSESVDDLFSDFTDYSPDDNRFQRICKFYAGMIYGAAKQLPKATLGLAQLGLSIAPTKERGLESTADGAANIAIGLSNVVQDPKLLIQDVIEASKRNPGEAIGIVAGKLILIFMSGKEVFRGNVPASEAASSAVTSAGRAINHSWAALSSNSGGRVLCQALANGEVAQISLGTGAAQMQLLIPEKLILAVADKAGQVAAAAPGAVVTAGGVGVLTNTDKIMPAPSATVNTNPFAEPLALPANAAALKLSGAAKKTYSVLKNAGFEVKTQPSSGEKPKGSKDKKAEDYDYSKMSHKTLRKHLERFSKEELENLEKSNSNMSSAQKTILKSVIKEKEALIEAAKLPDNMVLTDGIIELKVPPKRNYRMFMDKDGNVEIIGDLSKNPNATHSVIDADVFKNMQKANVNGVVIEHFMNNAAKTIPNGATQGATGIKGLTGSIDGYTVEVKILGKGGKMRLLGDKADNGIYYIKKFKPKHP